MDLTTKNIQPARDFLLITLHDAEKLESIILHEQSSPQFPYGLVMKIGPDVKNTKVGDKVLYLPDNHLPLLKTEKAYLLNEGCVISYLIDDEPTGSN